MSTFINENSIIFDEDDENKLEYTIIHTQFKHLIEEMLHNLLADLGLNDE